MGLNSNRILGNHPNQTLSWLEDLRAGQFNDTLLEWFNVEERRLTKEKEPVELYRAQGRLEVLGTLIELAASIRSYLDDVRTGKVTKIKESQPNGELVSR